MTGVETLTRGASLITMDLRREAADDTDRREGVEDQI